MPERNKLAKLLLDPNNQPDTQYIRISVGTPAVIKHHNFLSFLLDDVSRQDVRDRITDQLAQTGIAILPHKGVFIEKTKLIEFIEKQFQIG